MSVALAKQILRRLLLAVTATLVLGACEGDRLRDGGRQEPPMVVTMGSKGYTEQILLLKMTSVYLKEHGYEVAEVPNMASGTARAALEQGRIDLYWEYTGTGLVMYHDRPTQTDPGQAYATVRELDQKRGLIWLEMTDLNSSYAILMRRDKAEELGLSTLSDLAMLVRKEQRDLLFASSPEFAERRDGLLGLQRHYGFAFPGDHVSRMETGLLYRALKDDQVDLIAGIITDGRIERFDLVVLEDDREFFPAYNAAPVVRREVLEQHPELAELINRIPRRLDNQTMRDLTSLVDIEHEDVVAVVRGWLSQQNLITEESGNRSLLKQPLSNSGGADHFP